MQTIFILSLLISFIFLHHTLTTPTYSFLSSFFFHLYIFFPHTFFLILLFRQKDRRVGYFETSVVRGGVASPNIDYSVINKWNLSRRSGHILYCIDPAVPTMYHSTIKQGVLSWNPAFERAGCGSDVVQCLSIDDPNFPKDYARGDARYSAIYMTEPAIPVYVCMINIIIIIIIIFFFDISCIRVTFMLLFSCCFFVFWPVCFLTPLH